MGKTGKVIMVIAWITVSFWSLGSIHQEQSSGQGQEEDYTIYLKSRTFVPSPGVSPSLISKVIPFTGEPGARYYVITQFQGIPTTDEVSALDALDIRLLGYLPNFAWFASLPASPVQFEQLDTLHFHRATTEIQSTDKLAPDLLQGVGDWARRPDGTVNLVVQPFGDVSLDEGRRIISLYGGHVSAEVALLHALEIVLPESQIQALAQEVKLQWIDQVPPPPSADNDGIRAAIGVDLLQAVPYNLNGEGVVIGEWDGGWADPSHPDLAGRVIIGDLDCKELDCSISDHATHVAGTVLGDGTMSGEAGGESRQWRGMAPKAQIISFEWWDDFDEAAAEYKTAIQAHKISISTNSWGYYSKGYYEMGSSLYDGIVRGSLGKPLTILGAAGNEGDEGWGWMRAPNGAKNTIVVGATDSETGELCGFSSLGPTADGRLKPDVVAPGCDSRFGYGIYSSIPDLFIDELHGYDCDGTGDDFCYPYDNMEGTSMATPAVAGTLALILQQYRLTVHREPMPSTLKALLLHTARDLGPEGPDYQYGYGQVDARAAVDLIRAHPEKIVEAAVETPNDVDTYRISVASDVAVLKATLVWDDVPATLNAWKTLVTDLDLELVAPDGTIYYPWVLNPKGPEVRAITSSDHTNNVEQVLVKSPAAGEWLVKVRVFRLPFAKPNIPSESSVAPIQLYSLLFESGGEL